MDQGRADCREWRSRQPPQRQGDEQSDRGFAAGRGGLLRVIRFFGLHLFEHAPFQFALGLCEVGFREQGFGAFTFELGKLVPENCQIGSAPFIGSAGDVFLRAQQRERQAEGNRGDEQCRKNGEYVHYFASLVCSRASA